MADSELFKRASTKMMALCSGREYCRADIMAKLDNYLLKEEEKEKIIEFLVKERFIDEERYSRAFVNDKFGYNDWGRIKIASQLKMKHIPGNLIMNALGVIDEELYIEKISKLLAAKRKSIKAKNQIDLHGKLFRYGQSKGFESELLYRLINS